MLQIHRVRRHMLHLNASGETKQRGRQEKDIGYDKKGVEEDQGVSVAAQPGSVSASTLHRPTETHPSPKHSGLGNTTWDTQERTCHLLLSIKASLDLRSSDDCKSV